MSTGTRLAALRLLTDMKARTFATKQRTSIFTPETAKYNRMALRLHYWIRRNPSRTVWTRHIYAAELHVRGTATSFGQLAFSAV